MATTYTTNYNLGKQTNSADKFDMSVITDNMDKIDTQMKENADAAAAITPALADDTITNAALATFFEGIKAGRLASEITGVVSTLNGIVRAYQVATTKYLQIAEASDGTRRTRFYTGGEWGSWSYTPTPTIVQGSPPLTYDATGTAIAEWEIEGASGGVGEVPTNVNLFYGELQEKFYDSYGYPTSTTNAVSNVELLPVNGNTYYTFTPHFITAQSGSCGCFVQEYDSNQSFIKQTVNGDSCTVQTTNDTRYLRLEAGLGGGSYTLETIDDFMLNEGQTAESYQPHISGYIIPITITCGQDSETITINVSSQLSAADTLTSAEAGVQIPTYNGENTLSVGTTVQPASVKVIIP